MINNKLKQIGKFGKSSKFNMQVLNPQNNLWTLKQLVKFLGYLFSNFLFEFWIIL